MILVILIIIGLIFLVICSKPQKKVPRRNTITPESIAIMQKCKEREPLIWKWVANPNMAPELGAIDWEWTSLKTTTQIKFTTLGDGITYIGNLTFAEEGDEDYYDQPRVTGCDSWIEGTDIHKKWEGTLTIEQMSIRTEFMNKAFQCYSKAEEYNNLISSGLIKCYEKGIGTEKDLDKVEELFEKKAANGGIVEKYEYAERCEEMNMNLKASEWYQAALVANDASLHPAICCYISIHMLENEDSNANSAQIELRKKQLLDFAREGDEDAEKYLAKLNEKNESKEKKQKVYQS